MKTHEFGGCRITQDRAASTWTGHAHAELVTINGNNPLGSPSRLHTEKDASGKPLVKNIEVAWKFDSYGRRSNKSANSGSNSLPNVWVQPGPGKAVSSAGCYITESFDPTSSERKDYVTCPGDAEPEPFYRHYRQIGVLVSEGHRFALVNDYYATKASRVVLVDLMKHSRINASSPVQRLYQQHVKVNPKVIVQPEGYAFSPTENSILLKIGPTYFSVASAGEASQLADGARTRWYVVSTMDGRPMHEFGGPKLKSHWWD